MDDPIANEILRLCRQRGAGRTVCPSEVARALDHDEKGWRAMMPAVRVAAADLAQRGAVLVLQRGRPVDPGSARGPIRIGLAEGAG